MKIIRKGPELKRLTCKQCNSLLEYEDMDIFTEEDKISKLIKCPVCDFINNIDMGKFIDEKDFETELNKIKKFASKRRTYDRDADMRLKYHSEKYKDNYEFCLNNVKFEARNLAFVPEKHRDYQMCIEAITTLAISLSKIDKYNSHNFSEAYIEEAMTLFLIPDKIRTEKFILEMLSIFEKYDTKYGVGFYIAYVPEENVTRKMCIECVKYGANVNDLPTQFIDYDICKLCIESGGDMYDIETLGVKDKVVEQLLNEGYLEKTICADGYMYLHIAKK